MLNQGLLVVKSSNPHNNFEVIFTPCANEKLAEGEESVVTCPGQPDWEEVDVRNLVSVAGLENTRPKSLCCAVAG